MKTAIDINKAYMNLNLSFLHKMPNMTEESTSGAHMHKLLIPYRLFNSSGFLQYEDS